MLLAQTFEGILKLKDPYENEVYFKFILCSILKECSSIFLSIHYAVSILMSLCTSSKLVSVLF